MLCNCSARVKLQEFLLIMSSGMPRSGAEIVNFVWNIEPSAAAEGSGVAGGTRVFVFNSTICLARERGGALLLCFFGSFLVVTFLLFGGDPSSPSELLVEPLETDGILLAAIGARKLERVPRLSVTCSSTSFSFIFLLR